MPAPGKPIVSVGDPTGGKSVVRQQDLAYLGRFALPANMDTGGSQSAYYKGITCRRVSGQTRLLVTTGVKLFEYSIPALTTGGTPNNAAKTQDFGNFPTSVFLNQNGAPYTPAIYGLHYDNVGSKLYLHFGNDYNADYPNNPSFARFALDATGIVSPEGPWSAQTAQCKTTQGGMTAIPQMWANQYAGGKRLAVGFGGYYSVLGNGGSSYGPALVAISPPPSAPGTVPSTTLVRYNVKRFLRGVTNPPLDQRFDSSASQAQWTWEPVMSGVWVDTLTKHGVLFFCHVAAGACGYAGSNLRFEGGKHRIYVLDPAQLAEVAQGARAAGDVTYASYWDAPYPDVNYGVFPMAVDTPKAITSLTRNGTTVTAVTSVPHGIANNDGVVIKGADQAGYNVISSASRIDANTFSYYLAANNTPQTPGSGPATVQRMSASYPAPFRSFKQDCMTWDPVEQRLYIAGLAKFGSTAQQAVVYVYGIQ